MAEAVKLGSVEADNIACLSANIDGLSEQDLQRWMVDEEAADESTWKPICAGETASKALTPAATSAP